MKEHQLSPSISIARVKENVLHHLRLLLLPIASIALLRHLRPRNRPARPNIVIAIINSREGRLKAHHVLVARRGHGAAGSGWTASKRVSQQVVVAVFDGRHVVGWCGELGGIVAQQGAFAVEEVLGVAWSGGGEGGGVIYGREGERLAGIGVCLVWSEWEGERGEG